MEAPSDFAMQLINRVVDGPYPITISGEEMARLSETERLTLGKAAAKAGLVEYRNPAHPDAIRLVTRHAPRRPD